MTLFNFLANETWVVYKILGAKRKYFGDTAFGPMWKDFPAEVVVPEDLVLNGVSAVENYMRTNSENIVLHDLHGQVASPESDASV